MVEVETRQGWVRLDPDRPAHIRETDTIRLRGLPPVSKATVGTADMVVDGSGTAALRPAEDERLMGHVGLVDVHVDGIRLGEVDIVPYKISEPAYRVLRAELHRIWTDLVFSSGSPTSVQAGPPPARELWRRINVPLMQILDQPATIVEVGVEPRRMERVRRLRELTPAVVRAGQQRRPALTRTLRRTTRTPENEMCAQTMRLLRAHARRDPSADDVVNMIDQVLRHPVLDQPWRPLRRLTWPMRSDPRYRQILAVHQVLNRPELEPTEGPGELRLGVPAITRLYEYWVFLQVLLAATDEYGPPHGDGFERLASPVQGNRLRLEIERGTTVTFPGPVHVAFEPEINTRGDQWMGIEYVPHPEPELQQFLATPDVAVLDLSAGPGNASLTIIDAKYVGRHFVERDSARMHAKYARMRHRGNPVVRNVLVAHPHSGLAAQWAGYGHFPLVPGSSATRVPLPAVLRPVLHRAVEPPSRTAPHAAPPVASSTPAPVDTGPIHVIADQYWMRIALAGRRIDLSDLRTVLTADRDVRRFDIVMPRLPALAGFGEAAESAGWHVVWIDETDRRSQIPILKDLVDTAGPGQVVVVSGDDDLVRRLPATVETFTDLEQVASLWQPWHRG